MYFPQLFLSMMKILLCKCKSAIISLITHLAALSTCCGHPLTEVSVSKSLEPGSVSHKSAAGPAASEQQQQQHYSTKTTTAILWRRLASVNVRQYLMMKSQWGIRPWSSRHQCLRSVSRRSSSSASSSSSCCTPSSAS